MGKPKVAATAFGRWLAEMRRGRSYGEIAGPIRELLKPTGLKVNRSSILKAEQGRVPNVFLLYGLSRALRVPFDEMVHRLLTEVGVDMDKSAAGTKLPASDDGRNDAQRTLVGTSDKRASTRGARTATLPSPHDRTAATTGIDPRVLQARGVDATIADAIVALLDALTGRTAPPRRRRNLRPESKPTAGARGRNR